MYLPLSCTRGKAGSQACCAVCVLAALLLASLLPLGALPASVALYPRLGASVYMALWSSAAR